MGHITSLAYALVVTLIIWVNVLHGKFNITTRPTPFVTRSKDGSFNQEPIPHTTPSSFQSRPDNRNVILED